jgi:hypothetical protein
MDRPYDGWIWFHDNFSVNRRIDSANGRDGAGSAHHRRPCAVHRVAAGPLALIRPTFYHPLVSNE